MSKPVLKLIFISQAEANCPTQCADTISSQSGFRRIVSHIEKRLSQHGFSLISGDIVSRVEDRLRKNETREKWGRTEKALLLGADTGADAIFEVRSLFIDQRIQTFLKEPGASNFKKVPMAYAARITQEESSAAKFDVPIWEATVEIRMIDIDGNVIWTGAKTVRTTDILPDDWEVLLDRTRPDARIARSLGPLGGRKQENFDYYRYFHDADLQKEQIKLIIDDLIQQLGDASVSG
jgi:hypothetical protein